MVHLVFAAREYTHINDLRNVKFHSIETPLQPYSNPDYYQQCIENALLEKQKRCISETSVEACPLSVNMNYSGNMYAEIHRYASIASGLSERESRRNFEQNIMF